MTEKAPGRLYPALILALTALVYSRTLNYGPVNWDNELLRTGIYGNGLSPGGWLNLLKPSPAATYQPVRELVSALLAPFGKNSFWPPYHLVSLALYLGTVLIFYLTVCNIFQRVAETRSLTAWRWGAVAAAGVFALHPGHAEVVAWVVGQKDTLAGFLYLASVYFYIRSAKPAGKALALSYACYVLALGSKPTTVTLPFVLILYDRFLRAGTFAPENRRRTLAVYLAFFLPALAAVLYFLSTTANLGFGPGNWQIMSRLGKIFGSISFSAFKLLLPVNLCLRYPMFRFETPAGPEIFLYPLAAVLILYWTAVSWVKRKPYAFFLVWALLALLPTLNLAPIRIERADRYYYLASMGFSGLAGYAGAVLLGSGNLRVRKLFSGLALCLLFALGLLTCRQAAFWSDGVAAWSRVSALYPDLTLARINLGWSYIQREDYDRAIDTFKPLLTGRVPNTEALKGLVFISLRRDQRAQAEKLLALGLKLAPQDKDFLEPRVRLYLEAGDTAQARNVLEGWLSRSGDSPQALSCLVDLWRKEGNLAAAVRAQEELVRLNPVAPAALNELALLYLEAGDAAAAERQLELSHGLPGGEPASRLNLAYLYSVTGRKDKAFTIYLSFLPGELDRRGLEFMGAYYYEAGRTDQSIRYFLELTRIGGLAARGYNNAGVVCEHAGRLEAADSMYCRAIALDSAYVDAFYNRGNLLADRQDFRTALAHYIRADSLAGGADPAVLEALARTYSALGDSAGAGRCRARLQKL